MTHSLIPAQTSSTFEGVAPRVGVLASLLWLCCCAAAEQLAAPTALPNAQGAAVDVEPAPEVKPAPLLVWLREPAGAFTYEVETGSGRVLQRYPGVHIVVGAEVRALVKSTDKTLAWECDPEGVEGERPTDPPTYLATDVIEAVRTDGTRERLLYATEVEGNQEFIYRADIVASLGTLVVAHVESYYYYPCLTHGYPGDTFVWMDVATGQLLDLTKRLEPSTQQLEEARRGLVEQLAQLPAEGVEGLDAELCRDLTNLRLSEVKPRFEGGQWGATYVIACGVPYAVSAIYELQQDIAVSALTLADVSGLVQAPPEVQQLLNQVPGATLGGFGALPRAPQSTEAGGPESTGHAANRARPQRAQPVAHGKPDFTLRFSETQR